MPTLAKLRQMAHHFLSHSYSKCDVEHDPMAIAVIELETGQGGIALLNGEVHDAVKQLIASDELPSPVVQICVAAPSFLTMINPDTKEHERFEGVLFSCESPGVCEGYYAKLTRENGVNSLGPLTKLEGDASGRLVNLLPAQPQEIKQWHPTAP